MLNVGFYFSAFCISVNLCTSGSHGGITFPRQDTTTHAYDLELDGITMPDVTAIFKLSPPPLPFSFSSICAV